LFYKVLRKHVSLAALSVATFAYPLSTWHYVFKNYGKLKFVIRVGTYEFLGKIYGAFALRGA
jgi:hypothetical protein